MISEIFRPAAFPENATRETYTVSKVSVVGKVGGLLMSLQLQFTSQAPEGTKKKIMNGYFNLLFRYREWISVTGHEGNCEFIVNAFFSKVHGVFSGSFKRQYGLLIWEKR